MSDSIFWYCMRNMLNVVIPKNEKPCFIFSLKRRKLITDLQYVSFDVGILVHKSIVWCIICVLQAIWIWFAKTERYLNILCMKCAARKSIDVPKFFKQHPTVECFNVLTRKDISKMISCQNERIALYVPNKIVSILGVF